MLHVEINGPTLGSPSMLSLMTESVQSWLNKKIRKKLPNRIGTGKEPISAAAEAILVTVPKEVTKVSVQTEDETIREEQVIHQVEEGSTLPNLSSGPDDDDDYDSAFESVTAF